MSFLRGFSVLRYEQHLDSTHKHSTGSVFLNIFLASVQCLCFLCLRQEFRYAIHVHFLTESEHCATHTVTDCSVRAPGTCISELIDVTSGPLSFIGCRRDFL